MTAYAQNGKPRGKAANATQGKTSKASGSRKKTARNGSADNQASMPGAHVSLEPAALVNGHAVLRSAMDYGFVRPIDIPAEAFHPELQSSAMIIKSARDRGAKEFSEIILDLIQTTGPGESQDFARAMLAEIGDGMAHHPSVLEKSAQIVREYDLAKRRQFLVWEMDTPDGRELPRRAEILRELVEIEAGTSAKSRSMIVAGVNFYPTVVPTETVVLGESWVRIGDIVNLVSGAGMGKSVAGFQAAIAWALGLPYFGIKPPRPIRILIFSGEDDGVTIGQSREGFLEHSLAITGRQLTAEDLAPLDSMIRTEFIREHVGERFHPHLAGLLRESPVDLVIINPLLSYVGGEIVACASEFLRAGLMPILQEHQCAALLFHHTPKLSKDSWSLMDDTYSGIGGGEIANIPRSILTLKPTPADGLFVITVSKRQTTGWKDGSGKFTSSYFVKRSGNPERPAWIPVDYDEAEGLIADAKTTGNTGKSARKVKPADVVAALQVGPTQRQALIDRLRHNCSCSDRPAKEAIREAENDGLIDSFTEPNPGGGNHIKWLCLPQHKPKKVA